MEKHVISIKQKPKQIIARRSDGTAVVRIREEGAKAVEKLMKNVNGDINLIDIVTQLLVFAAENVEIKIVEGE